MPACNAQCPVVRAQLREIVKQSPELWKGPLDSRVVTDPEVVDQSLLIGSDPQTIDEYGKIKVPFVSLRKDDYDLYSDVDDPRYRIGQDADEKRDEAFVAARSDVAGAGIKETDISREASIRTDDRQISGSPSATRSRSGASAQEYSPQWSTVPGREEVISRTQSSQRSDQVSSKTREEEDTIRSMMSSKASSLRPEADETDVERDVTQQISFVEEAVGTEGHGSVAAYESGDTRVAEGTEMDEVYSDRRPGSKGSRTPSGVTEQELYQEDMDAGISGSRGGSAGDVEECDPTCPRRISNRRRLRKLAERQKCVDVYYLTKGSNYFEDVCTCSLACVVRALRDDPFVQSILTSAVVFTVGLKLCSELNAWYLPFRIV